MYLSDRLSPMERKVYDNLIIGRNATAIETDGLFVGDDIYYMSKKTARCHITNIFKKCKVKSALELVAKHYERKMNVQ